MKLTPALGSNPLPSAQQLAFQSALALVSSVLTATPEAALASLSSPEEKIQGWERSRAAQLVKDLNTEGRGGGSCGTQKPSALEAFPQGN